MMKRREFLHCGLMGVGAAASALHTPSLGAAPPTRRHANDVVQLGPEKIKLSRLAMGTGTYGFRGSSNQTRQLGVKGISDLFQFGYDNGLTFWDSADGYGSHPHLKETLRYIPRDRVAIMSKTQARDAARMRSDLDRFRKEIGTDYLDIVLLHAVREGDWTETRKGAMEVLSEAKEKGIVRTLGISCHSIEALRLAAKTPWVEVDLARINPWGLKMDADPATVKEVLREMKRNGKGVIGMKIIGEGQMRHRVDDCLTHAMNLDCIDCFTIGAESRQELGDLIARIPKASQREWAGLTGIRAIDRHTSRNSACNCFAIPQISYVRDREAA